MIETLILVWVTLSALLVVACGLWVAVKLWGEQSLRDQRNLPGPGGRA